MDRSTLATPGVPFSAGTSAALSGFTPPPTLDHIGIAVRSIASARAVYSALGLAVGQEETVPHEQVRVAMVPLGPVRLELIEPTAEDSPVGRFLSRRGEGLHHIALRVGQIALPVGQNLAEPHSEQGIDGLFARLQSQGVRLASPSVRHGAGGHRCFFLHPESAGGVLIEFVGSA